VQIPKALKQYIKLTTQDAEHLALQFEKITRELNPTYAGFESGSPIMQVLDSFFEWGTQHLDRLPEGERVLACSVVVCGAIRHANRILSKVVVEK